MKRKNNKWNKLFEMQGAIVCPYCLKPILDPRNLTIGHEPPRSRQNELDESQKIYACNKYNHEKGALTTEEYAEWRLLEFIRNGGLNQRTK